MRESNSLRFGVLLITLLLLTSCGGAGGEGEGGSVNILVDFPPQTSSLGAQQQANVQPSNVGSITTVMITADCNGSSTVETVDVTTFPVQATIFVPLGTCMFTVALLDANGQPLFSGMSGIVDIFPGQNSVTIQVFPIGQNQGISGVVTNAVNGLPIAGATIEAFQGQSLIASATTDLSGSYAITTIPPGTYTLRARASGFLDNMQQNVSVVAGQPTVVNFSLSPPLGTGQFRIVLTWGAQPSDLDSHLWLPPATPFHLFFGRPGNTNTCPFAQLDVDDTSSFGPETVTISRRFPGTYLYAVNNFSGEAPITVSGAQVRVFDSTGLIATFNIPTSGTGVWWSVFTLDGTTGNITPINQIGGDPSPYSDTAAGCSAMPSPLP